MTREELYEMLKKKWEQVDKNNLEEIKAYNRWARKLRKEYESEVDGWKN